jgi:hypothetical protein
LISSHPDSSSDLCTRPIIYSSTRLQCSILSSFLPCRISSIPKKSTVFYRLIQEDAGSDPVVTSPAACWQCLCSSFSAPHIFVPFIKLFEYSPFNFGCERNQKSACRHQFNCVS